MNVGHHIPARSLEYTTITVATWLWVLPGCAAPAPATVAEVAVLADVLDRDYNLELTTSDVGLTHLAWQPPACQQVYRVRIDEQIPEGYMRAAHVTEEHSEHYLVLAPDPEQPNQQNEVIVRGQALMHRPGKSPIPRRELLLSHHMLGPASPDAACFERTWHPIEDALSLGWPFLPGRLVGVGETWTGNPVEARCNRIACINPETRGGGEQARHLSCVTMSWHEHLDGLYQLPGSDEPIAAISSFWSDGHPLDVGVWSERSALVTTSGRVLYAHTTIHHNFLGITRDIVIDAVDDCPGSLPAKGFEPSTQLASAVKSAREHLPTASSRSRQGK